MRRIMAAGYNFQKPREINMRQFMGMYTATDENDMSIDPKCYAVDGHNFRITKGSISSCGDATLLPISGVNRIYGLHVFNKLDIAGNKRSFLLADFIGTDGNMHICAKYMPAGSPTAFDAEWHDITGSLSRTGEFVDSIVYAKGTSQMIILVNYYNKPFAWNGPTDYSAFGSIYQLSNDAMTGAAGGIELYNERVFTAGGFGSPNYWRWSDDMDPTNWVIATNGAGGGEWATWDNDVISGIRSAFGALYLFKRRKTARLTGDVPKDFKLDSVNESIGAVAPNAIAAHNGVMYFISEQGLVWFNGVTFKPFMADELHDFWERADQPDYFWTLTVFDDRLIVRTKCKVVDTGKGRSDHQIASINLITGAVEISYSCIFGYSENEPYTLRSKPAEINGDLYFVHVHAGDPMEIYKYGDGFATCQAEKDWRYTTPSSDLGHPEIEKSLTEVYVSGSGGFAKITPLCDGIAGTPAFVNMPETGGTGKAELRGAGRKIGFMIESADVGSVSVSDAKAYFIPLGIEA